MTDTVTMPAKAAMFLAAGHLNNLHAADQDMGCCPVCCGPCAALKQLLDSGQLDEIVRGYASGGWDCWDINADRVDRGLLARAWRMTDCHDEPHHLAHQTPPGVFDPNCPACKEDRQ